VIVFETDGGRCLMIITGLLKFSSLAKVA
jgi:hypothetical protein